MAEYCKTDSDSIIRISDMATIPADPQNRDWQDYTDWCDAGGVADPYDPPPAPQVMSVSKLGLIRALREAGSWPTVKAAIAADDTMQEDWDAAQEIRRADPLVQAMIAHLSLTEAQVDVLMSRATELVA